MPRCHRIGRSVLALLTTLSMRPAARAQDAAVRVHDHQTWAGLGVGYSFKRTKLSAKYVCRNYGAFEGFKASYYYLSARTRLSRHISADVLLRVADSHTADFFRLEAGLRYRIRSHHDTWYTRTAFFNERRQLIFGEAQFRPPPPPTGDSAFLTPATSQRNYRPNCPRRAGCCSAARRYCWTEWHSSASLLTACLMDGR